MELMNKELLKLTKEWNSASAFKQDPRLATAIDKLYRSNVQAKQLKASDLVLPERKLDFYELQNLLKDSSNDKGRPYDVLLKEANNTRKVLIKKVEEILENINKSAEAGEVPKITIRNQRLWSNCIYNLDRVTLKSEIDAKKTTVTYNSKEDRSKFNTMVFVLTKVHELLSKNITVTRRELFYQNVTRFRIQTNLDVAVRDVCCLLETPPWNLGIVATAKGLIAGPLTMHYADGNMLDCAALGGMLIPQDIVGIKEFRSTAKYILVVEKDAVFQKLLDEGVLVRLGPVILMTGKGYPDVCTRQLLCRLCSELQLNALALVDADPHGFEIFLTYKYGSLAQSHLSSALACSSLRLVGALHSDVTTLAPTAARLTLSDIDKRKLKSLISRPYLDTAADLEKHNVMNTKVFINSRYNPKWLWLNPHNSESVESITYGKNINKIGNITLISTGSRIKEELNVMLRSGIKAEIEALAPTAAALCDAYLPAKLIHGDYLG